MLPPVGAPANLPEARVPDAVKKGKIHLVVNNTLKEIEAEEIEHVQSSSLKKTKLESGDSKVRLNVQAQGKVYRITVKISNLAAVLGKRHDQVIEAAKKQQLTQQLAQQHVVSLPPAAAAQASGHVVRTAVTPAPAALSSSQVASPQVAAAALQLPEVPAERIREFGLSKDQYEAIQSYYRSHKAEWDKDPNPRHIAKEVSGLARSIVYYPQGAWQGLYVLGKSHGGLGEVGVGLYNRATLAFSVDKAGEIFIFRSASAGDIKHGEMQVNELATEQHRHLAVGLPFHYEGPVTKRDRDIVPAGVKVAKDPRRPRNLPKIGMIMEFLPGGELGSRINNRDKPQKNLSSKQLLEAASGIAQSLSIVHDRLGFVHRDLKPENIFTTREGSPRVGDFGFAVPKGRDCGFGGTPGFIAPEAVSPNYKADTPLDIWSLGCILSEMKGNRDWTDWTEQGRNNWRKILDKHAVKNAVKLYFPNSKDKTHIDYAIAKCLEFDPKKRPSAQEVFTMLQQVTKLR